VVALITSVISTEVPHQFRCKPNLNWCGILWAAVHTINYEHIKKAPAFSNKRGFKEGTEALSK